MSFRLQTTALYQNQKDAANFSIYGEAVESSGLVVRDGISGAGLCTRGFLWELYNIWLDPTDASPLSTGWTAAIGYSGSSTVYMTGWTAAIGYSGSSQAYSTSWTASSFGVYGEAPQ